MGAPSGEARCFSTRALMSEPLPLFLFKALGSSFARPVPLALSFFRAAILAADRLRAPAAGARGGLLSKKRTSSPSRKPRPSVGVAGLWVPLGTSRAALGDVKAALLCEEDEEEGEEEGLGPVDCSTLSWTSSALRRRLCRSSFCFCFCCFSNSAAEMDFRGAPAASLEAEDAQKPVRSCAGVAARLGGGAGYPLGCPVPGAASAAELRASARTSGS